MSEGSNKLEAARELGVCIITDGRRLDGTLRIPTPVKCCTCQKDIHPTTTMLTFISSKALSNHPDFEKQLQSYYYSWRCGFKTWGYIVDEKLWLCGSCFDDHMTSLGGIFGMGYEVEKDNELFLKQIPLFERLVTDASTD